MACVSSWMTDSLRALVATRDVSLEVAEGYKTRIELLYRELLATELEQGTQLFRSLCLVYQVHQRLLKKEIKKNAG